jgi:hypothetical protein
LHFDKVVSFVFFLWSSVLSTLLGWQGEEERSTERGERRCFGNEEARAFFIAMGLRRRLNKLNVLVILHQSADLTSQCDYISEAPQSSYNHIQ